MKTPLFAPFESFDHGLAELLTLTMSIKDDKKGLKGRIVVALARLEQNVIQNCSEGNTIECPTCEHLNDGEVGICTNCLGAL